MQYATSPAAFQQYQQPVHGFVYVTGPDGANAYQMPPNSEMPLFDSTVPNRMFIKTTDGAGYPTIMRVRHDNHRRTSGQRRRDHWCDDRQHCHAD